MTDTEEFYLFIYLLFVDLFIIYFFIYGSFNDIVSGMFSD